MANVHVSLDSSCKSRISKISTRFQNMGGHSTTVDPELKNEFRNFSIMRVPSTTCDPELRNELKFLKSWGVPVHRPKCTILTQ